jgi:hypothetical protein
VSEKWYLRSQNDGDAHHCDRVNDDGTVTARCGLTFLPERRLFGEGPAVVRPPVDPIQACPQCRAAEKEDRRSRWGRGAELDRDAEFAPIATPKA